MTDERILSPQLQLDKAIGPKVVMETNVDEIEFQLFEKQALMTVENFVRLAEKGYYDGMVFHRVIKNFMIQSGDSRGDGTGGQSIWGHPLEGEFSPQLLDFRGTISMANSGPSTNGSQFFIVQNQNMSKRYTRDTREAGYLREVIKRYKQGGTPWPDFHHTVSGRVIKGVNVVDTIAKVATNNMDKPDDDIVIESITIKK